ncbi:glycosyltransferase family 4 protein [Calidifontibacter indicus]|uniref:glycosyltransferase family 4 protein n=1 Tax=Calidifontibacter indicus TaxID=419650 RepID=UPI003D745549
MAYSVLLLNWRDLEHPEAGGAEKYLVEVAEGLAARGHHVTFRTALYPGALPREVVNGVNYIRKGGHYSVYTRAIASQAVRRLRADVVVDVQNGVPFLSTAALPHHPVVNLVHHVHREQWPVAFNPTVAKIGWQLESALAPFAYRRAQYVAVSETTRRELVALGVDGDRVAIIPNGTDLTNQDARPADHPVVTVLGRLVPHKRVEIAIRAVAALRNKIPGIELRVVGSGYWLGELRDLSRDLGIADQVVFTGHVSEWEKRRILSESWVLALPSIKEGWGLVVVEAATHHTPSIAYRSAGGVADSIQEGRTGLLVDDGQEPFTGALEALLTDEKLRHTLGDEAARFAAQFTWPQAVQKWENLLQEVIDRYHS